MHVDKDNNLVLSEEDKEKIIAAKNTFLELNTLIKQIEESKVDFCNLNTNLKSMNHRGEYNRVGDLKISLEDIFWDITENFDKGFSIDYVDYSRCYCCAESRSSYISFEQLDDPCNWNYSGE